MTSRLAAARLVNHRTKFGPVYGPGFADHVPMVCISLAHHRAPEGFIANFQQREEAKLRPAKPHWIALNKQMDSLIEADGADGAIQTVLPSLLGGVGKALFHGLIRTALGRRAGLDSEVAAGLAICSLEGGEPRVDALGEALVQGPVVPVAPEATWRKQVAAMVGEQTGKAVAVALPSLEPQGLAELAVGGL